MRTPSSGAVRCPPGPGLAEGRARGQPRPRPSSPRWARPFGSPAAAAGPGWQSPDRACRRPGRPKRIRWPGVVAPGNLSIFQVRERSVCQPRGAVHFRLSPLPVKSAQGVDSGRWTTPGSLDASLRIHVIPGGEDGQSTASTATPGLTDEGSHRVVVLRAVELLDPPVERDLGDLGALQGGDELVLGTRWCGVRGSGDRIGLIRCGCRDRLGRAEAKGDKTSDRRSDGRGYPHGRADPAVIGCIDRGDLLDRRLACEVPGADSALPIGGRSKDGDVAGEVAGLPANANPGRQPGSSLQWRSPRY